MITVPVCAQINLAGSIAGGVITDEQLPVEAPTVILMNAADSAVVKVEVGDKQGFFSFSNVKPGNYLISIGSVGFIKTFLGPYTVKAGEGLKDIGKIILKIQSKTLREVEINSKERFVEVKPGKVILNIESSILSAGGTAFDILARAPGVQVDNNDNIKLKGKDGVMVMMNGRQIFMEKENLIDLLKSTQSSNIESIELISNPSAKYAAAGIASIINIRIKKNKNYGTNGVVTAMAGVGDMGKTYDPNLRYNGGLNFNHRNKILNIFGNYSHSDISQSKSIFSNRQLKNSIRTTAIDVDYFSTQQRLTDFYQIGTDYNIGSKHIIGVLFNGSSNKIDINKKNGSTIYNQGKMDSAIYTQSGQTRKLANRMYNFNYKGTPLGEKSGNLSADLDYLSYNRTSLEYLTNNFVNASGSAYRDKLRLKNSSPSQYTIQSLKIDYSLPLNSTASLDVGVQSSKVKGDSRLDFGTLIDTVFKPDARFTNQYTIDERIRAAYFSYNKGFKNSNLVLGLRVEKTNTQGLSVTTGALNSRNYIDLFPNLQYTRNLNKNNKLFVSYGRRIGRPGYDSLNPFLAYLDQYSFRSGNPLLRPAYTQNLELTHIYKENISTTFRTSFVNDFFLDMNEQNDQTFVNTVITKNLDKQFTYGMEVNAPLELSGWWNLNVNVQANMVKYATGASFGRFSNSSPDIIITTLHAISLSKKIKAEVSAIYESPTAYGIYNFKAFYNVDAGFSASLFQNQGSLKLRITDLFNISQSKYSSTFENLNLMYRNKNDSRTAQLSFSYSFGKKTIKSARKRKTGSESEQSRVGN